MSLNYLGFSYLVKARIESAFPYHSRIHINNDKPRMHTHAFSKEHGIYIAMAYTGILFGKECWLK